MGIVRFRQHLFLFRLCEKQICFTTYKYCRVYVSVKMREQKRQFIKEKLEISFFIVLYVYFIREICNE